MTRFLALRAFLAFAMLASAGTSSGAQTLKVLTAGAFKQVVVALVPAFEASTGMKVEVQNDTAGALARRIQGGESFDLVFLTTTGLTTLAGEAKVDAASVKPLAKVGIGVAVKAGAPQPSLQTVEQFKDAVLKANKVAYIDPASGGSSGIYLDGLFQRLGIADAVRAKAVLVPGGYSAEVVANGAAELAIQQISELLPVAGTTLVGPLPEAIQNYTTYGGAVATRSEAKAAAMRFLASFITPESGNVVRSKGMLPAW